MRKTIFTLSVFAVLTSCDSTKKATTTTTASTDKVTAINTPQKPAPAIKPAPKAKAKTMLLGKQDRTALEEAPFASWYNTNYAKYTVSEAQIPEIKKNLKGVTITTFMGTWCGDSKRETPRIFKILDEASFKNKNLELITVDRSKKNPKELTEGNNIIRVPTFIFKKDGKEIGRIVERPVESLEADILKILNGDPYKHSYEK